MYACVSMYVCLYIKSRMQRKRTSQKTKRQNKRKFLKKKYLREDARQTWKTR